jgi:hypothetical protein
MSGIVAAPWIIPSSAWGADGATPPSERLTMGVIGNGMMGRGHLARLLGDPGTQVLAVCDVDRLRCDEGKRRADEKYAAERASGALSSTLRLRPEGSLSKGGAYRGCAAYNDYREMLARPDIDAVVIATCDHWHTLQSVDAAKAGKDIYCEKPISVTIQEGRTLAEAVRRYGRIFQTGTQYRSSPTIRTICNFVRNGGLGRIKSAFTLWSRLPEKYGRSYAPVSVTLPAEPVPEGLDWDLWVGPAPWHDYNHAFHMNPMPGVVPWAFCEDFGAGSVTWSHSHSADVVQYGLGMENSGPVEIIHPNSGRYPTLTCKYANGALFHFVDHWGMVKDLYKAVPATARLEGAFGGVFVGERGWVTSMHTGGPVEGSPPEIFEEMGLKTRELTGGNNHHANWFECIRTRGRPSTDEEIGHRAATLGHLAIIAFKLCRSLKWDPVKEEFIGDEMANRMRARAMREPWRM